MSYLDQWLIDDGMCDLGPFACVHCSWVKDGGFSQPLVTCSLAAFLESIVCAKPDGSAAWHRIQIAAHGAQQDTPNQT